LCENKDLVERLTKCLDALDDNQNDLDTWTDSLEELSEIEGAFEKENLSGKTILDIGTDCVKPLYIALKLKPERVVGINEDLRYSYTSVIEQKGNLLTSPVEMRFYNCSFFDDEMLKRILREEKVEKFDFVLVSKTLHHLRSGEKCIAKQRDEGHRCQEDEECCIYEFEEQAIFDKLLTLGTKVIVYEFFDPTDKDDDKIRGRGGYFTKNELNGNIQNEWDGIFKRLSRKYNVEFIAPKRFHVDQKNLKRIDKILKEVNTICFYVREKSSESRSDE